MATNTDVMLVFEFPFQIVPVLRCFHFINIYETSFPERLGGFVNKNHLQTIETRIELRIGQRQHIKR